MKYLYLIRQYTNRGYDTYDSAVVCAETEEDASKIHPGEFTGPWVSGTWTRSPDDVNVQKIGEASDEIELGSVICASFNAG